MYAELVKTHVMIEGLGRETVGELLRHKSDLNGDTPLVHYGDVTLSYAEMNERSDVIAGNLADLGISEGTPVAVLMNNRIEYVSLLFALGKLGAIMVPLNSSLRGGDLVYHVENSDSRVLVVEGDLVDRYLGVADRLEIDISIGVECDEGDFETEYNALRRGDPTVPNVEVSRSDPFAIIHTSGTTGLPKGVLLPHRSYLYTGQEYGEILGLEEGDTWYTSLPLFHCNAQQTTLMGTVAHDITMAIGRRFSASSFWSRVERHDATIFNYIGEMIPILLQQDNDPQETTLRLGAGGGANADDIADFEERYGAKLLEGFGLTETGTVATKVRPEMSPEERRNTEGTPVSNLEVAIVDTNDELLDRGNPGEIVIRPTEPYTMMLEYYGNPIATVESCRNLWFHTGDIGRFDSDGNLHFMDRKSFTIRRRGENISSREVERVLLRHPSVDEAAVVAVHGEIGEEVKAYIVGDEIDPAELVAHCRSDLADFKVPRFVEVVSELEKTETEKIKKKALMDRGIGDAWDRNADP